MVDSSEGTLLIRRALSGLDHAIVLAYVDQLDLTARGRTDVVVLAPLRNLHRGRNVASFVTSAPAPAVRFVGEMLSNAQLERVVSILKDAAESPTFDQLNAAVNEMLDSGDDPGTVALMLAVAAAHGVPASDHCRVLLETRSDLALPEIDVVTSSALAAVHEVDPNVKEQRRLRREAQRQNRQKSQARPPTRSSKSRPETTIRADGQPMPSASIAVTRRTAILTPNELVEFSMDDLRGGDVCWMRIEHDTNPTLLPGEHEKVRPALIVSTSSGALLVRPIYSDPATDRELLVGWNRIGLERPSYVARTRLRVDRDDAGSLKTIGRLSDDEWNSLL